MEQKPNAEQTYR